MAKALKVKSTKNGYRRAGHSFSTTSETILFEENLTEEQVKALKEDALLLVIETEAVSPAEAEAEAKAKAKAKADK